MRVILTFFAGALALLVAAGAALAGQPVDLRPDLASHNGKVTLADLFEDAGGAGSLVIANGQPGMSVVLDAARVQMVARAQGLEWSNAAGMRRIIVQPGFGALSPSPATIAPSSTRAPRMVEVLTYVRSLNTGEIVRAEDLAWTKGAAAESDAARDADSLIGMAARHPLREGAPASLRDVSAAQVIKKDDVIAILFSLDGVNLTLQAKALESAATGQSFSAINPNSKKIIQAVATGPGQAVVGPAAEQIRAARNPTALIASLR